MDALESTVAALLLETPLSAAQAARHCGVSVGAVARWIRAGRLIGERRVKLEGYPAGRSWMTTREALSRFLAAALRAKDDAPDPPADPSADVRRFWAVAAAVKARR